MFGRELARLALGQAGIAALSLPAVDLAPAAFKPWREAFYEAGAGLAHAAGARW